MVTQTKKVTPPQYAKSCGIAVEKVIAWIRSGELRAIDGATRKGKRPRYLIDVADIEAFELARQVSPPAPRPARRRRQAAAGVIEFFS